MRESFLALSPASRLLAVNQVGINLGFYLVLPFLATYLRDDLGLAAATVGLVLGARTLCQQGLFLPSGALVDRVGPWPLVVAGLALRVVAFLLLGLSTSTAGVVAGVLLVGVAGAVFNPAVRTYLALEEPERRAEAFAVMEVAGHVGTLAGPLLGAVLLGVDFRLVCLVAAGVFAVLTTAQLVRLPRRRAEGEPSPVLVGVRRVLGDRHLLALVVSASAYLALFNQLYLALPLETERVTGRDDAIGAVFLVSSVLGILLQVRVTAWCRRRWSATRSSAAGIALMAVSFLPLAASSAWLPAAPSVLDLEESLARVAPVLACVVLLSIGICMVTPFVVVLVAEAVGDRLIGTAYGWYYLVSAVATLAVAWASGALLDLGTGAGRVSSALLLVGVGVAGATGLLLTERRAPRGPRGVSTRRPDGRSARRPA